MFITILNSKFLMFLVQGMGEVIDQESSTDTVQSADIKHSFHDGFKLISRALSAEVGEGRVIKYLS